MQLVGLVLLVRFIVLIRNQLHDPLSSQVTKNVGKMHDEKYGPCSRQRHVLSPKADCHIVQQHYEEHHHENALMASEICTAFAVRSSVYTNPLN